MQGKWRVRAEKSAVDMCGEVSLHILSALQT